MAVSPLTLTIAKFSGSLGRSGVGVGDFSVLEVREIQKRLKAIEPRLRTELVREVKSIAKPQPQPHGRRNQRSAGRESVPLYRVCTNH